MKVELADEMVVCLTIFELSGGVGGSGSASYDELVGALDGRMDPQKISANLDYLFDLGIINGKWVETDDGYWTRSFFVSGEAGGFVESAYRRSTMSRGRSPEFDASVHDPVP